MTVRLAPAARELRRLADVAQRRRHPDVVVAGGRLLNVFTEEVLDGWGVALLGDRIAYVGPEAEQLAGPETELIDAAGCIISPGLVEGHTHLQRIGLAETARFQVAAGVTTTILEMVEIAYVCGPSGVREVLLDAAARPGRVFATVPPLVGLDPVHEARLAPVEEWLELLDHPLVLGVGEIYWADLLRGHRRAEALIAAAHQRDLAVEGHLAGARLPPLNALSAMGVSSDHEGVSAIDVLSRLRLGLHAMVRQGATRQDLAQIASLWRESAAAVDRLSLVTDGVDPDHLAAGASLNAVVDAAVAAGLPLPRAVRLASLGAAEHFGLGRWLGGIAPGRLADLVLIADPGSFRPQRVLVGGRDPVGTAAHEYPGWMRSTTRLPGIDPALLEHPGPGSWRAIEFTAPLVTREAVTDGAGACTLVALDRTGDGRAFRGLLLGSGLSGGAVALTSGWESPCVVAAGDHTEDMLVAIQRVRNLGGGAVVAARGRVVGEWRADLAGVVSTLPASRVTEEVVAVNGALRSLGCPFPNPLLSLETLTSPAIPHLRLWAGGYVRLKDGARLGLVA
jgi:adenine deaminase